jgi:hypothetical protein
VFRVIPCPSVHPSRASATKLALVGMNSLSPGVCRPSDVLVAGSDLHRTCLVRLCCAFRFSQPPDALIPPAPFRLCFMPVTSMGFCFWTFGAFPPISSPPALTHLARSHLKDVCSRCASRRSAFPSCRCSFSSCFLRKTLSRTRLQGFAQLSDPFTAARCYPRFAGRYSLGLVPLRGISPSVLAAMSPS